MKNIIALPATFMTTVSFLLLLLVALSVPIINSIYLFKIEIDAEVISGLGLTGEIRAGVFGFCSSNITIAPNGTLEALGLTSAVLSRKQCDDPKLGYKVPALNLSSVVASTTTPSPTIPSSILPSLTVPSSLASVIPTSIIPSWLNASSLIAGFESDPVTPQALEQIGDPLDISGLSNAIIKPLTYTLVLFPIGTGFTGAIPIFLMLGWWRQNGVLATIALVMAWFAAIIVWLAFILAIISFSIAKNRIDDMDGFKGILGSGIWLSLTAAILLTLTISLTCCVHYSPYLRERLSLGNQKERNAYSTQSRRDTVVKESQLSSRTWEEHDQVGDRDLEPNLREKDMAVVQRP